MPILPPQQVRRFFRSYLAAYRPTPMLPTSPLAEQTIQPTVQVDDTRHLGPMILPRTQWGAALRPAPAAGLHAGFVLNPGRDGLYIEQVEPNADATVSIFVTQLGGPPNWVELAASFGVFHSYNPANPDDPPKQSGFRSDGYMTSGTVPTADIAAGAFFVLLKAGTGFPPSAFPPIFIPPTNSLCICTFLPAVALTLALRVNDPSFVTSAR